MFTSVINYIIFVGANSVRPPTDKAISRTYLIFNITLFKNKINALTYVKNIVIIKSANERGNAALTWNNVKKIMGRVAAVIIPVAMQFLWYLLILKWLSKAAGLLSIVLTVLAFVFVLYINTKREESSYKTLWLIVILTFPVLGTVMYIIFGNNNPARKLEKNITKARLHMNYELPDGEKCIDKLSGEDKRLAQSVKRISEATGFPMVRLDSAEYFPVGEDMFEDMCKELEKAEKYIFAEYFILQNGKFLNTVVDIMARKAAQGVDVRIMYDDLGSIATYSLADAIKLGEKGIKCIPFNPFLFIKSQLNNRDHRKIMVIDGRVAYSGGINLSDEYINIGSKYGHWKDIGFKITGDGVKNYTYMFMEFWNAFSNDLIPEELVSNEAAESSGAGDGYVLPYYDSPMTDENVSNTFFSEILYAASDYVWFYTPYLMLGDSLFDAFIRAAKRGVDVRIIMPGIADKKVVFRLSRSYYRQLIEAGVKIYEYTPGFVHAKGCICDDKLAVLGSVNLDYRSLFLHFECSSIFFDSSIIKTFKADILDTQSKCKQRTLEDTKRGFFGRLIDGVLRIFAPLL